MLLNLASNLNFARDYKVVYYKNSIEVVIIIIRILNAIKTVKLVNIFKFYKEEPYLSKKT